MPSLTSFGYEDDIVINFGDAVIFDLQDFAGFLTTYAKDPTYLIVGAPLGQNQIDLAQVAKAAARATKPGLSASDARKAAAASAATAVADQMIGDDKDLSVWQLQPEDDGKSQSDALTYGKGFLLYNPRYKQYVSDDKTSRGFDGADGYYGLVDKARKERANTYMLESPTKKHRDTVCVGDTCYLRAKTQKWHCLEYGTENSMKKYSFNHNIYLVWDSPERSAPVFKIFNYPS